jgi:hypothetical protein
VAAGRRPQDDPPPPFGTAPAPDQEDVDVFDALEKLRVESGPDSGHKVHLMKERADAPGSFARIKAVPLQGFDLDALPSLYGGGTYILQITGPRGTYVTRYRVTFDTDIFPRNPTPAGSPAAAPAAPAGASIEHLMLIMSQERAKSEERFSAMLTTLLTTMIGNSKPPSIQDQLAQLTAIKAMTGDNPRAPIELIRDAVRQGIEIANTVAGRANPGDDDGDEGGGNMARLIEKGIDTFSKLLEARQAARPAAPAAARIAAGTPGVAGGAAPAVALPLPEAVQPYAWLVRYVPDVIKWANAGFSVQRAAAVVYQLVPDDRLPELEAFARIDKAERHEILARLDGRLSPYLGYLDEIAAELINTFDQDEEDDDTDGDADSAESA